MFDFHLHSTVSPDGKGSPADMLRAAEAAGLREICFTDHLDYDPRATEQTFRFETQDYNDAYDGLTSERVVIRRGMEFGMLADNAAQMEEDLRRRPFDFVIGSVHFVEGWDIYYPTFWEGKTMEQAERSYLEHILDCVNAHNGFDVLGHLTYITKAWSNPTHRPVEYAWYADLVDEIFRVLIRKGKGIEVNTSGMDICGRVFPDEKYLRRFKELGGSIVTVGSDAHAPDRVGQYCAESCRMVREIFGYVCTFKNRMPVFHKL